MFKQFEKQLQVGGWILIAVLIIGGVWMWQNIGRTSEAGNVSDTITVSGTGKVSAVPDIAVADIAISVQGATAKAAQDSASAKSKTVVDYLKKQGIKDADIKTSGYNIYPQSDYNNGTPRVTGYQVTQSLTVKIRNLDTTNTILDGVVAAGANQVNSLQFQIDKQDELKAEARRKAIDDAHTKAEALKNDLGVELGKIVGFTESNDSYPPIMYATNMKSASGMGGGVVAPVPDIPTGENDITVNVTVTYQIK